MHIHKETQAWAQTQTNELTNVNETFTKTMRQKDRDWQRQYIRKREEENNCKEIMSETFKVKVISIRMQGEKILKKKYKKYIYSFPLGNTMSENVSICHSIK